MLYRFYRLKSLLVGGFFCVYWLSAHTFPIIYTRESHYPPRPHGYHNPLMPPPASRVPAPTKYHLHPPRVALPKSPASPSTGSPPQNARPHPHGYHNPLMPPRHGCPRLQNITPPHGYHNRLMPPPASRVPAPTKHHLPPPRVAPPKNPCLPPPRVAPPKNPRPHPHGYPCILRLHLPTFTGCHPSSGINWVEGKLYGISFVLLRHDNLLTR